MQTPINSPNERTQQAGFERPTANCGCNRAPVFPNHLLTAFVCQSDKAVDVDIQHLAGERLHLRKDRSWVNQAPQQRKIPHRGHVDNCLYPAGDVRIRDHVGYMKRWHKTRDDYVILLCTCLGWKTAHTTCDRVESIQVQGKIPTCRVQSQRT